MKIRIALCSLAAVCMLCPTVDASTFTVRSLDELPAGDYTVQAFLHRYETFTRDTGPPDPDLECQYSQRFRVDCYNRIQQQEAYDLYRRWTSPDFPRFLIIEIQHANPFYDDSYAVNSANLGPYGDAITYELIPYIEETGPAGADLASWRC